MSLHHLHDDVLQTLTAASAVYDQNSEDLMKRCAEEVAANTLMSFWLCTGYVAEILCVSTQLREISALVWICMEVEVVCCYFELLYPLYSPPHNLSVRLRVSVDWGCFIPVK